MNDSELTIIPKKDIPVSDEKLGLPVTVDFRPYDMVKFSLRTPDEKDPYEWNFEPELSVVVAEVDKSGNQYTFLDGLRIGQLRQANRPYDGEVGVKYVVGETPYFEWNLTDLGEGFSPRLEDAGQLIINQDKLRGEVDVDGNRKGPTNLRLLMNPQQCEGLIRLSEYGLPSDSSTILYRVEDYIDPSQRESNVASRLVALTPDGRMRGNPQIPGTVPSVGSLSSEVVVQREAA